MKKQPEVTNATRQKFIDVFCELYEQKPIEKITIQELTRKSGFSRSTFYQYFCDIYDLLDYVENDILKYINTKIIEDKNFSSPNLQCIINVFEEKEKYFNALLGKYGSINFLERLKQEIPVERIGWNLDETDPIDSYLTEFYVTTTLSLFRLWQKKGHDLPPEQIFDLILRLRSDGINDIIKNS